MLLLSGCSASLVNRLQRLPESRSAVNELIPWFQGDHNPILYKTTIDIYQHHFSGLMVIKPVSEESHRVVFITETGIKIFDMEFFRTGDFRVHYCLEAMNRKPVIKALGNDMTLMLYNIPENGKTKIMQEKGTGKMIIKSQDGNGTRYWTINDKTGKVDELIRSGTFTDKLNIRFFSTSGIEPDSIIISHYNMNLKIHLTKLNDN